MAESTFFFCSELVILLTSCVFNAVGTLQGSSAKVRKLQHFSFSDGFCTSFMKMAV